MEEVKEEKKPIKIEPNSKPMLFKRILSYLCDISITFVLFFCLNLGVLASPMANTLNKYKEEIIIYRDEAKIETGYGKIVYIEEDEIKSYKDKDYYIYQDKENKTYVVENIDSDSLNPEIIALYNNKMNDQKFKDLKFGYDLHSYALISFSFLIVELVMFLIIPLVNKKRGTIGELLCGVGLFSIKRITYAKWHHVLFRFFIIYIVETMLPYLVGGIIGIICYMVISFIVTILSKKYRTIRDFITLTMLIDTKSYAPIVEEE